MALVPREDSMKKYTLLMVSVMAVGLLAKGPSGEIEGTDLVYKGPGSVTSVTNPRSSKRCSPTPRMAD